MTSKKPFQHLKLFLVGVILTAAAALGGFFAFHRFILDKPQALLTELDDRAQLSLKKIHQTATRSGITEWSLNADSARYLDENKRVILENLSVEFFMDDDTRLLLTADRGALQTDTNDIEVRDNVHVIKEDLELWSDALQYNHQNRTLTSDTAVRITSNGSEVTANTFSYDLNTRQAVLNGDVRGIFRENVSF